MAQETPGRGPGAVEVVLTHEEREVLARLAAFVDDRWLAGQLAGIPEPGRLHLHRPSWVRGSLGAVLLIVGAVVALATFTGGQWTGALGLVAVAAGGVLLGRERLPEAEASPGPPPWPPIASR